MEKISSFTKDVRILNEEILRILWSAIHRTENIDYWVDFFCLKKSDVNMIKRHDFCDLKDVFSSNLSLFSLNIPTLTCTAKAVPSTARCSSAYDLHLVDQLNLIKLKYLIVCRYLAISEPRMVKSIFDLSESCCSFLRFLPLNDLADLVNEVSLVSRCDFSYLKNKNNEVTMFFPKIMLSVY